MLEGSVRKAGNRVRISVQLVDTATDSQRWSQTYDRELKDVFAVQEEIAKSVADQLRVTLVGDAGSGLARPSNENLDAYKAYLQAQFYFGQRNTEATAQGYPVFARGAPTRSQVCRSSRPHVSRTFGRCRDERGEWPS